jgi:hypothetical protein
MPLGGHRSNMPHWIIPQNREHTAQKNRDTIWETKI